MIRLLGRFSVSRAGEEIPAAAFQGRLVRRLIRILASRRGSLVPRDALVEALWPHGPPADPDMNLSVLVNRARRALGDPSLIATGPGGYSLGPGCEVDAEAFAENVQTGRRRLESGDAFGALRAFRSALELWRGEPLAEDAYEEWAQQYRSMLERSYQEAVEGAASACLVCSKLGEAVQHAGQAVARDPLREPANLLLVRSLAAAGDSSGALEAYGRYRETLADELGLDPSPEAEALELQILRGEPVLDRQGPAAGLAAPPQEGPFVGREGELSCLLQVISNRKTAVVAGPAGSGKSRLVAEAAARSEIPVIFTKAFYAERDEPWSLLRMVLREALQLDVDAAAALPKRSASALADVLPEMEDLRPVERMPFDSQSRRALVIDGALRLVQAAVAKGGVLILDDLQWTDESTIAAIHHIMLRIRGLAVIIAFRPEEAGVEPRLRPLFEELGDARSASRIDLGPLPEQAISELAGDRETARIIAQETDRSPWAVGEVLRALRESAAAKPERGAGRPSSKASSRAKAELVCQAARTGKRRAVESRLAAQSERGREIACLLSLMGRNTPVQILSSATQLAQAELMRELENLARADLVQLRDTGWGTSHDLIAQAVNDSLSPAEKARLHLMLSQALKEADADPSEIARHLEGAGDAGTAAGLYAEAAQRSLDSFATEDARTLAEAGLRLGPQGTVRAALLETRAEALARAGDTAGARSDFRTVLSEKKTGPERSRILARMAMVISGAEDYRAAGELAELAIIDAGTDPGARAAALGVAAIIDLNCNRMDRADKRSAEALELFQQVGDAIGASGVLDGRATCRLGQGRIREAADLLHTAVGLFEDSGQLLRACTSRAMLGVSLCFMERMDEALGQLDAALQQFEILGHPEDEAFALSTKGWVLTLSGRYTEGQEFARRALERARALGHHEFTTVSLLSVGFSLAEAGRFEEGEPFLREAIDRAKTLPVYQSWGHAILASELIKRGELDAAETLVARALAESPPMTQYDARLAQVELAAAKGDPAAASLARRALELAEQGGHLLTARKLRALIGGAKPGPED